MKKSRLKQIIREEYQTITGKSLLKEDIIDGLIKLFLDPIILYKARKLSQDPEWIELRRQAKIAAEEMETKSKNLELIIKRREEERQLLAKNKSTGKKKK